MYTTRAAPAAARTKVPIWTIGASLACRGLIQSGHPMNVDFWNQRFSEPSYAYGTEPNDFLRDEAERLPPGRALLLAEGEGRNAVFLATRGFDVVALDHAVEGRNKALALAAARGVHIDYQLCNLAAWSPAEGGYAAIVSIFVHTPPRIRQRVHRLVPSLLAPGGVLLLEAYGPGQLQYQTGGPREAAMLPSLEELERELPGLEWEIARNVTREVVEGVYHTGTAATIQLLGRRPA